MRRTLIAAAWLFGTSVPVLAAVVFYFGCCVLPFHAYLHKVLPLCQISLAVMSGEHQPQPMPAREKQEPAKRMATTVPRTLPLAALASLRRIPTPIDASAYRSFIALGALRCDQDVGLHLLTRSLLI